MQSLIYSFLAGSSTLIGAALLFFIGSPGRRMMAALLGFAGGIMLAISLFDLMPEALEMSGMTTAILSFVLGCGLMFSLDILLPHAHLSSGDDLVVENAGRMPGYETSILRTGYLIFFGIALHNLPEGLAIGAGLESSPELGLGIAVAIGLHNIPEGLAVAGPLKAGGVSAGKVLLFTFAAGMMTVVGTAAGLALFDISTMFVGASLSFAAGAMFYIVNDELVPQANAMHSHLANVGLIAGLLVGFVIF